MPSPNPQWYAWMLCRFAELMIGFVFFELAKAQRPELQPKDVGKADRPIVFGLLLELARRIVRDPESLPADRWFQFLASRLRDREGADCVTRINQDRNNIAHGRAFRSPLEIRQDLEKFVSPESWRAALREGAIPLGNLSPWVCVDGPADHDSRAAVLDRWNERKFTYVAPCSGGTFSREANS